MLSRLWNITLRIECSDHANTTWVVLDLVWQEKRLTCFFSLLIFCSWASRINMILQSRQRHEKKTLRECNRRSFLNPCKLGINEYFNIPNSNCGHTCTVLPKYLIFIILTLHLKLILPENDKDQWIRNVAIYFIYSGDNIDLSGLDLTTLHHVHWYVLYRLWQRT